MIPQVSLGLPVYNGENYLKEALDSILAQTFEDFELIISDNASVDGTEDICRKYAQEDSRIHYSRTDQNYGAAFNFNKVFSLARGTYFKWLAHDDICKATYLEQCVQILDGSSAQVALSYPRARVISHDGTFMGNLSTIEILSNDPVKRFRYLLQNIPPCTAVFGLIRSEALRKTALIGGYQASDVTLLIELSLLGQFRVVPEELFVRRKHSGSSLHNDSTPLGRAVWFDPANKGKIILPRAKLLTELAKAIHRATLSPVAKTACYRILAQVWLRKYGKGMIKEIVLAAIHGLKTQNGR